MSRQKQFNWSIRVYYEDTDASGVVYYANYLKFMERARSEWLRSLGFEQNVLRMNSGIVFVVRSASIDYHQPARFNDTLQIRSHIQRIRRASLTFAQDAVSAANTLLCCAQIRVACVRADNFKPQAIPAALLHNIAPLAETAHAG